MKNSSRKVDLPSQTEWEKRRDTAQKLWVIAVLGFWVSLGILILVYFLKGGIDLILLSICLGLMILGVWLKARFQLMLRKGPLSGDHGEDH